MVKDIKFKEICEEHIKVVADIYNYFVTNTTVSFHTEQVTISEMRESVINSNPRFKSFVIDYNEKIVGYVLITQHKKKQAYDVSAEVTIYLNPNYVGKGIGGKALKFIESVAFTNGFHVLVATICSENGNSRYLFEKNGYYQCAHFKEIGMKFERRLDIYTYQKIIS